jgi:flagellar FliL protein
MSNEREKMAEEEKEPTPETEEQKQDAPAAEKPSSNKKKLIIFAIAPILVFAIIAAILYFTGLLKGFLPNSHSSQAAPVAPKVEKAPEKILYYDLPEIFINLNNPTSQVNFLKISLSLEVNEEEKIKKIEEMKPRIIDQLQIYLRQLKADDLKGSAGLQRLREELLLRINSVLEPAKINDVLFKEMLLQ